MKLVVLPDFFTDPVQLQVLIRKPLWPSQSTRNAKIQQEKQHNVVKPVVNHLPNHRKQLLRTILKWVVYGIVLTTLQQTINGKY